MRFITVNYVYMRTYIYIYYIILTVVLKLYIHNLFVCFFFLSVRSVQISHHYLIHMIIYNDTISVYYDNVHNKYYDRVNYKYNICPL